MRLLVVVLIVLLFGSNAFWLYRTIDGSVSLSYKIQQVYELEETRKQLMSALPALVANSSKEQVIGAVQQFTDQEAYEKDGCMWVGWLGMKFGANGKLEHVSPSWSYGDSDPCYPPL